MTDSLRSIQAMITVQNTQPEHADTDVPVSPEIAGIGAQPDVLEPFRLQSSLFVTPDWQEVARQVSGFKTGMLTNQEYVSWARLPETLYTGSGDDQVDVHMGSDGRVHVNVNGEEKWSGTAREFQSLIIDTGAGNDRVTNAVDGATILTGDGDDAVNNEADRVLIDTGEGDDKVTSRGWRSEIVTGRGDDVVYSSGNSNTIRTEDGYDQVQTSGDDNKIETGSGNDLVWAKGSYNTIRTGEGSDFVSMTHIYIEGEVVDDRFWKPGKTINSVSNDVDTGAGDDIVHNESNFTKIRTGEGNDQVRNSGYDAAIDTGEGNDNVWNTGASASIQTGDGDDYVENKGGQGTEIATGIGQDMVEVSGNLDRMYRTVIHGQERYEYYPDGYKDPILINTGDGGDKIVNKDGSKIIVDGE